MSTMLDEIIAALKSARETAMEQTVMARIPECGKFGGIAQDLDWAVSKLEVERMNQGDTARIEPPCADAVRREIARRAQIVIMSFCSEVLI